MRKGSLTREQAIEMVGLEAVEKVDGTSCEPTNRVQCDGDTDVEFAASVDAVEDGYEVRLHAYYYQDEDILKEVEDLDQLEWEVSGYEVI